MSTRRKVPKLCLHKASGRAFVLINRKPYYLGAAYGTPEAQRAYAQFLEQLSTAAEEAEQAEAAIAFVPRKADDLSIVELLAAYLTFAEQEYRKHGRPTRTIDNIRLALRTLDQYFGDLPVREFGPLKLKALRQKLLDHKLPDGRHLTRGVINERVRIIVHVFKWGVENELIAAPLYQALRAVAGLRAGQSVAREPKKVQSVPDKVIEATLPYLPAVVADMVKFQRYTGCRPGEVCSLRPCDVQRYDEDGAELAVWIYQPASHKTEHYGKERVIHIGPRAQDVLRPYLLRSEEAYCFTPAESEARQRQHKQARRQTPLSCGTRPRPKDTVLRTFAPNYCKDSYAKAIKRACDLAFQPPEEMTDAAELRAWRVAHRLGAEPPEAHCGHGDPQGPRRGEGAGCAGPREAEHDGDLRGARPGRGRFDHEENGVRFFTQRPG